MSTENLDEKSQENIKETDSITDQPPKIDLSEESEVINAKEVCNSSIIPNEIAPQDDNTIPPNGEISNVNQTVPETEENKPKTVEAEESAVVINKQSDSLRSLQAYDDSEDTDSDSDESDETDTEQVWRKPKDQVELHTSDSESDSSDDDKSSEESIVIENPKHPRKKNKNLDIPEEDLLPPVADLSLLNITIPDNDYMPLGVVVGAVNKLVTIEAFPNTPAFDIETFLFMEQPTGKKPIGEIHDVLGPVSSPIYVVRFNSPEDIEKLGLKPGVKVFSAPKSEYSKFVFVKELMKLKGSDASWLNDQEPPPEMLEFSDDEQEFEAKRKAKRTNLKRRHNDSLERHQRYERTMNRCNLLNTRVSNLVDAQQNIYGQPGPTAAQPVAAPPYFDPSIPPPGFMPFSFVNGPTPWSFYPEQQQQQQSRPNRVRGYRNFPGPSSNGF